MNATPRQPRSLRLDTADLDIPQPWAIAHRNVEYSGEVIIAETLNPRWLLPLEGGLDFRLVFFTVPRRIGHRPVEEPRTALVVPTRAPTQADPLGLELRAIREARARYVTPRERDGGELRSAMANREQALREELAGRYAVAYAQGRIYTHRDVTLQPLEVFSDELPESWVQDMAAGLLNAAFPSLPFDAAALPDTLTPERVADVFRSMFQEDQRGQALLFASALGLTMSESSGFDAARSQAVRIVADLLDGAGGRLPVAEVAAILGSRHGLPTSLAALYVMAFVRHARADLELTAEHRVQAARGGPFLADRITWDFVPDVAFSEALVQHGGLLRLESAPTWNTVLPYATLLRPELQAAEDSVLRAGQEALLLEHLAGMAGRVEDLLAVAQGLEGDLGASTAETSPLDRLRRLSDATGYGQFHAACQQLFGGTSGLRDALAFAARLEQLASIMPAVGDAQRYLGGIAFGTDDGALELEHTAISARLQADSLLENPSLWSSVEARLGRFKEQHSQAYRAHHGRYHDQGQSIRRSLDEASPLVDALARFTEITELGEPAGLEGPERIRGVVDSLKSCSIPADEIPFDEYPRCQSCVLGLDEEAPQAEAQAAVEAVEAALREYSRRLGSHSTRMVLAGHAKEPLAKFVELVQVADPSALAGVLDDDVVTFLREFLRSG